jgi:hypothetical protein
MSPTLLEGVVILVILVVAWQLGIRLAPIIFGVLQRAIDQLDARRAKPDVDNTKQATKPKLLTDKEKTDDQSGDV